MTSWGQMMTCLEWMTLYTQSGSPIVGCAGSHATITEFLEEAIGDLPPGLVIDIEYGFLEFELI